MKNPLLSGPLSSFICEQEEAMRDYVRKQKAITIRYEFSVSLLAVPYAKGEARVKLLTVC